MACCVMLQVFPIGVRIAIHREWIGEHGCVLYRLGLKAADSLLDMVQADGLTHFATKLATRLLKLFFVVATMT